MLFPGMPLRGYRITTHSAIVATGLTALASITSPVKLPPSKINPILPHRHPQILHRQHRPPLPTAPLPPTAKPRSLHSQNMTRIPPTPRSPSLLICPSLPISPAAHPRALVLRRRGRGRGYDNAGGRAGHDTQRVHRVVGCGVRTPHAAVLVGVGGDVGDEFLGREREEAR